MSKSIALKTVLAVLTLASTTAAQAGGGGVSPGKPRPPRCLIVMTGGGTVSPKPPGCFFTQGSGESALPIKASLAK